MQYENPIIPGFYPDPSICSVGSDYYLVNSSFEYFPGVPIFHSRDLITWRQIGNCLNRESQLKLHKTKCSDGIYAPTIRHKEGVFYMATTNALPGEGFKNFYVTSTDPDGEWSDPIYVKQGGIDPSLCFASDGKVYWTGNGTFWAKVRGIYQSEINITTGELLTEPKFIWSGSGGSYPEAPHLFQRGGYYYLSVAEGGTAECHMATIARSKNPFGPFEACPHNPVLSHRSLMSPIQAAGHADFFEDHVGRWWVVFLGIRYAEFGYHNLGRETFLAPVTWTSDDWPIVNEGERITLSMDVDRTMPMETRSGFHKRDDFDSEKLWLAWVHLRNPNPEDISLTERHGWLRLSCGEAHLNELANPSFVGRRQQHFECQADTLLDFAPLSESDEAGLTVLIDDLHHAEIVVTQRNSVRVVLLRRKIGTLVQESGVHAVPGTDPIQLRIISGRQEYVFAFQQAGGDITVIGQHEVKYVSTEVAGGYTGVIIAMYATANGKTSEAKAYFDWFDYQPL